VRNVDANEETVLVTL